MRQFQLYWRWERWEHFQCWNLSGKDVRKAILQSLCGLIYTICSSQSSFLLISYHHPNWCINDELFISTFSHFCWINLERLTIPCELEGTNLSRCTPLKLNLSCASDLIPCSNLDGGIFRMIRTFAQWAFKSWDRLRFPYSQISQ